MWTTSVRPARLLAAAAASGLLLPAQPATASCAEDAGPDGSAVVFVGTAGSERRGYIRFAVDEVWSGPDLAPTVWIRTGQEQPAWPWGLFSAVGSSTDAELVTGERYVVGASRSYASDVCTVAEATASTHARDARGPVEGGSTGADPPIGPAGQLLWTVSVLGVVAAAAAFLRRSRRGRRHGRRHGPSTQ
jgi:hypothetical protein